MSDSAVLGVFAHPDDEQLMSGTLADCAAKGIRTGLICTTRGEAGQIHSSVEATRDTIGTVREAEMRAAAVTLGVKHLWMLNYRDSGWIGTPDNEHPASFNMADQDEATAKIVRVVREFRPSVIVTFDPTGGYGHLDHLMVHRLSLRAFQEAGDASAHQGMGEPWQAKRLLYAAFPRSLMSAFAAAMRAEGAETDLVELELEALGLPDEDVDVVADVRAWLEVKDKSLRCHRSQHDDYERWSLMPREAGIQMRGFEYFAVGAGIPIDVKRRPAGSIFDGLGDSS